MKVEVEPIRTEDDYKAAVADVDRLWGSPSGTADGDRLDVLLDLVEVYERKHYPMPPPSPVEAIRFVMEQRGLKPIELGRILGSTPRAYDILSGRRKLSIAMIRALHRELDIPLDCLIGSQDVAA